MRVLRFTGRSHFRRLDEDLPDCVWDVPTLNAGERINEMFPVLKR